MIAHEINRKLTGVYCIHCTKNGKNYIGSSSICFIERWRQHKKRLRNGNHHSKHLQYAWLKFGEDSFVFSVIEYCQKEDCVSKEQFHMDLLKSADDRYGFNICKNAGSLLGHRHSPETKLKIGAAGKGRKATEETRAKLRARTWSLETIQKRRVKMIGHLVSLETRAKIRAANSGRKLSMEHRAKLRAAKLGKKRGPHSEETKAKMRKPHKSKRAEITRAQPET